MSLRIPRRIARRTSELALVAACAAALAVFVTWPTAARFGSAGRLDSGDGRFSVWNVAWVANALTSDPAHLWNANIFYPHAQTLAYSEANLIAGVLGVPVWLATGNPYATSNWTILCAFILAAVMMYALVRHLTGSWPAAALSAVLFAFCAFMLAHIPHIQLLMTFGLPLALLRMHWFVESPSPSTAVWLGVAIAIQALACGYYGIFGGLAVALGVVWFSAWTGQWRQRRYWGLVACAAGVSAAIVAPFFLPYLGIRAGGFDRSLDDARLFRAGWRSYLASPLLMHEWMLKLIGTWREVLFPGFLATGLAVTAVVQAMRARPGTASPVRGHVLGFYLLLAGLAMWASFGPDAGLYALLYRVVPFMSMLRAPARIGVLVTLGIVVAGGLGFAAMERRWSGVRRRVLLCLVMIYAVARSSAGELNIVQAPHVVAAYRWLGVLPRAAVAEFPYFSRSSDRYRQTDYMLMSLQHWQPLINGYSDFMPEAARLDMLALATFPSPDAWRALERRHARYVVIHWDLYGVEERARIMAEVAALHECMRALVYENVSLYQIERWPSDERLSVLSVSSTGKTN